MPLPPLGSSTLHSHNRLSQMTANNITSTASSSKLVISRNSINNLKMNYSKQSNKLLVDDHIVNSSSRPKSRNSDPFYENFYNSLKDANVVKVSTKSKFQTPNELSDSNKKSSNHEISVSSNESDHTPPKVQLKERRKIYSTLNVRKIPTKNLHTNYNETNPGDLSHNPSIFKELCLPILGRNQGIVSQSRTHKLLKIPRTVLSTKNTLSSQNIKVILRGKRRRFADIRRSNCSKLPSLGLH